MIDLGSRPVGAFVIKNHAKIPQENTVSKIGAVRSVLFSTSIEDIKLFFFNMIKDIEGNKKENIKKSPKIPILRIGLRKKIVFSWYNPGSEEGIYIVISKA